MKAVFADTFYLLALLNTRDPFHGRVVEYSRKAKPRLVTTAWVLTELADGMTNEYGRRAAVSLIDDLRHDKATTVVECGRIDWELGLELYAKRLDKRWSLTDCISFVVMQQFRITEALTGDHHFAQAGFTPLFADA